MKKNSLLLAFLFIVASSSYAQEEASYWYFGQNAGLRFNAATGGVTAITDGQINTLEGCTSISDTNGDLLFYSDGRTIWNAQHQPMPNANYFAGTGLLGDPSSTSSGLIVPKPQDPTKFYLFTVDEPHHDNANVYPNQFTGIYAEGATVPSGDDGFNNGLNYSLIDINLEDGLGDVDPLEKNIPLISYDINDPEAIKYKCSEKITAVKADDCSSFWVITHFVDTYYAYKVDINGVNTEPQISVVGPEVPISGYRRNALGYIKASPDGTKLAVAHLGFSTQQGTDAPGGVYLMDFDNNTGTVSNSLELYSPSMGDSPYGVEFSAENKKVYATVDGGANGTGPSSVLQWNLESSDIPGSMAIIHQSNVFYGGALQLGLDKRIYRAQVDLSSPFVTGRYLGVINNPEADGTSANYDATGILLDISGGLQNTTRLGLPPFIQSLFNSQIDIIQNGISTTELKLCEGDSYTLIAEDVPGGTYAWTKDGVALTETTFELFVDQPGFYEVYIEPNNGECPIEGQAVVGVFEIPTASPPTNMLACDNATTSTFDLSSQDAAILNGQNASEYTVKYFTELDEAENGTNEITTDFSNTENPQTIYARVENTNSPNCFDITSFEISVVELPTIDPLQERTICDNSLDGNTSDGIGLFDLSEIIPEILNTQEQLAYTVSFHPNQQDAEDNQQQLTLPYYNVTPYTETIVLRIESNGNTNCFLTRELTLNVNDVPTANAITIIQCDEDGIPEGFTTYDLNDVINAITNGEDDRSVIFYESVSDLENNENALESNLFDNYLTPQTLYVLVTNTQTGCANIAEITLEISTTASSDTSLEACDDDGIEDGIYNFDLEDARASILLGLSPDLEVSYYQTYDEALSENNPIANNFTNTIPYAQTVYARVENANACFGISEIDLTVFELPNIITEEEVFYCLNTFPETITLDSGFIDDIPNNYYYNWSTGEDTIEIEVNTPGVYTVRVTSTDGCFKDRTITVSPSNTATFVEINITDATSNNSISVLVSGEGTYQYALDDPNGPYQDSPIFDNVPFGLHTVYVQDIKNDCGIIEEQVSVIGFPKFFTPNGDTFNPYWQVKGISELFQPQSQILIYDRHGKLITELDPLGPGWDGTYNGFNMPSSDYWFMVNLEDGRTFTGHFALKR
ncbi:T9SS type B sorting domain-containing protein [Sediminibacter sp. Hel_I_10]|uniref:T9SS type B sorting domain-containing protein n=1 Tax=Sediminibacter sp. Hel_I_10 TaxID=1392490 RepID=UPI00047A9251|nr:T9SS type B sorting domain-containing protein [Sediminibacter sp. Hel_I_10]